MNGEVVGKFKKLRDKILKEEYDLVILVVGDEGEGKSTLALQLAQIFDKNFNVNHVYFEKSDIRRFLRNIEKDRKGRVHIFDEGEKFFEKLETNSTMYKVFNSYLKSHRALQQFYIVCSPDFELSSRFLRRVDIVIVIPKRGLAYLYTKNMKTKLLFKYEEIKKRFGFVDLNFLVQNVPPAYIFSFDKVDEKLFNEYEKEKEKRLRESSKYYEKLLEKRGVIVEDDVKEDDSNESPFDVLTFRA